MQHRSRLYPSQIVLRIASSDEIDSMVAKSMSLGSVVRAVFMVSTSGSCNKASAIVVLSDHGDFQVKFFSIFPGSALIPCVEM